MRKKYCIFICRKMLIMVLIIAFIVLSSCSKSNYNISTIEKTKINQTYYDLEVGLNPSIGNVKIVLIPVWFLDSSEYIKDEDKEEVREDINAAFFGNSDKITWTSVTDFYKTESNGKLNMSGRTSDWYNSNCYSSLFYNDMEAIKQLVVDASNWFFETYTDEDRRDYDSDEDGFLDCVSLIYAADDFKTAKRNDDNMWAFQHFINDSSLSDLSTPGANCFFWASYDFVFDKDNRQNIDTRTFIHEIGHTFGLRDYYDCGYQYSPGGGYTIMDMAIAGLDPYSVMALGWAEPYIPTESMTLKIGAFQKSREIILLTPNWNEYNSPFDEYLLLELYTPTGLNEYHSSKNDNCKQVGIRVWHIDSRLIYGTDIKGDLVTDASSGVCTLAMSNTYYNENGDGNMYLSELGEEFYNYNLIQCINANSTMEGTYKFADTETRPEYLNTQEKFTSGTSFSFDYPSGDNVYIKELDSKYNNFNCEKQFVNKGKLNSGKELGWSFAVEKIEGEGDDSTAIISLIKK